MTPKRPKSTVALLRRPASMAAWEVCAVSRRGKPQDLGLPGGGIEPGETPLQAVIRETREEIGVTILQATFVFERIDEAERGNIAWCYLVDDWEGEPHQCEPGIEVSWTAPERLLEPSCTFHKYNLALFRSLLMVP
jgi:mutator protein MutT